MLITKIETNHLSSDFQIYALSWRRRKGLVAEEERANKQEYVDGEIQKPGESNWSF